MTVTPNYGARPIPTKVKDASEGRFTSRGRANLVSHNYSSACNSVRLCLFPHHSFSYGVSGCMPSSDHSGCIFQACYLQAQFEISALRSIETEGAFVIKGGVRSGRCFCGRHQLPHRWGRGHCVGGVGVPLAVLPERFVP